MFAVIFSKAYGMGHRHWLIMCSNCLDFCDLANQKLDIVPEFLSFFDSVQKGLDVYYLLLTFDVLCGDIISNPGQFWLTESFSSWSIIENPMTRI